MPFHGNRFFLPASQSGRSLLMPAERVLRLGQLKNTKFIRVEEDPMTPDLPRRSLLALGAGLGASAMLGGTALAKAPKVGTQPAYFYRFGLGDAEVTVVSDAPLPLGPPKGT